MDRLVPPQKSMSHEEIIRNFPALRNDQLLITSPKTPIYNCIAFAAGDESRWWWPDVARVSYWPRGVQRSVRLAVFQQAFESLGFRPTGHASLEPGIEKIVLYCKDGLLTHAA